jgi:cobalt-zinc-cadmium efflux system outer membrane protein
LLSHQLKHNRHVVDSLFEETIPSLEKASTKAGEAYQSGGYRYSDWHAVQQALIAAQTALIEAYTNIQLFNIELERLTGASISK